MVSAAPVIEVDGIVSAFGAQRVHDGVTFSVNRGTLVALIGGSGTGKSVLLREMIGLHRPTAGSVRLLGTDMWAASDAERDAIRQRFGMLFQDGALFSSLTVAQNVAVPLREHTTLSDATIDALVALRLEQAGLPPEAAAKRPSEISGGMRKRAAIARAIALEPEILFLDEPTSGLDPITARGFDRLVRSLVDDLGLTVFLVTHDLDTLLGVVDRLIVLARGRVIADGRVSEVMAVDDPWLRDYFSVRRMVATGGVNGS
ncbi:ATP-binding cassette domain-containing protein [Aquincola sp. S2]|uniref:ATP-binding cassette domain-containing protein n=1 Tax=Pseudaquabacterium terrae TaxID=2732868 RepID=A0ABX2EBE2_9BURK|nr:ATP-binding cassette domain-containing protein [Aquabacterium terrae]NRF65667.1 ATP-binding cassette domain-containing protein [Aquabacterium terrae]